MGVLRYPQRRRPTWSDRLTWAWSRVFGHLPFLGWHVDGAGWQHHLHSRQQALVGLLVWGTDTIRPGCGMTAVVSGSHRVIARLLAASRPRGLAYMELFLIAHIIALCARIRKLLPCNLLGR